MPPIAPSNESAAIGSVTPIVPPGSPSTTHPCSNPDISTCFHLIAEQMNKTEELLRMANETLSVSNKDGTEVKSNGSSEMVPPAPSQQHIPPPANDAAGPAGNFCLIFFKKL